MTGRYTQRYAAFVAERSKIVIVLLLLLTAVVTAGVAVSDTEEGGIGDFEVDAPETRAADYVEANYGTDNTTAAQLVVREENALSRESLLAGLEFQQEIREDESLNATVTGIAGIENLVATAAVIEDRQAAGERPPDGLPPLSEQIESVERRSDAEIEALLARLLDPDATLPGLQQDPSDFLPTSYKPGETTAESRLTLIVQVDDSGPDAVPQESYDAQVAIADLAEQRFDDAFVFGQGVNDDASSRAVGDSFAIITPVALVLVLFVLAVTYRDVLDVILAFVGIAGVMAWLTGLMGWLNIAMSQLLIAVPFLLIGLSIDYALHVVMRYREARQGTLEAEESTAETTAEVADGGLSRGVRAGMAAGLAGVVLALAAATFSTGVGFLSNVVSPLPAIRGFAMLSAGGILATFVIFAGLVPALKVEVDGLVENRLGRSRRKPAFGVEGGIVTRGLSGLADLASRAPLAVILLAALLATGGVVGATGIDTEFNQADFLPEDPPGWTEYLPGGLAPGEYTIAEDFAYLSANFGLQGDQGQSQVLIREGVTDGAVLPAIEESVGNIPEDGAIVFRPDGTADVRGPHTVLRDVAASNETVAAAIEEHDTDGDGLPDEDAETVYGLLFETDEEAASGVLSRDDDGTITSARLLVNVEGSASSQDVAADTQALASGIGANAPVSAVATGGPVTTAVIQDALLETLVQAFAVTLVVILLFLVVLFWVQYRAPTLGLVTLTPVLAALAWLLGAMSLLGIPFNSETAVITSLAIGLGVDYSIHAGERFLAERERRDSLAESMRATITGTGGALLASASTTAAGFGVLGLALAPPLRRFGLVTGLAIIFAFVACVTVLPCLLVVRERVQTRLASG